MKLIYSRLHDLPALDGHKKKREREPLVKNIAKIKKNATKED